MVHIYDMPLEAIIGPMFAGKTSELIRRLERENLAETKVILFKHRRDQRYSEEEVVVSHDAKRFKAHQIRDSELDTILKLSKDAEVVAVDEVQFFPADIVRVINQLLHADKRVMFTCLNLNFRGEPFNDTVKELLPRADNLTYLTAVCMHKLASGKKCGREATMTQRIINGKPAPYNSPLVLVAGKEAYEARCFKHHEVPGD